MLVGQLTLLVVCQIFIGFSARRINLSSFLLIRKHFPFKFTDMAAVAQTALASAKRLIPLFDRVLIQRAEALTKTRGGIVIPEKAQGKVLTGTVVAVGPGSRNSEGKHVPVSVKVGDQVLLPEYGGTKVELAENKEFHLFRESDILAKIES